MDFSVKHADPECKENNVVNRMKSVYGGHIKNIQGQRFGNLTAVYPTNYGDYKGSVVWACQCDCKKIAYVSASNLVHGNTKSCGCLRDKHNSQLNTALHFVDGTCVEWIESRKHRRDNKSGFRGVQKVNDTRFRVTIGFKGEKYHLGYFPTLDEAKEARLKAEDELYLPFIQEFHSSQKE